jgi:hypothetical protein
MSPPNLCPEFQELIRSSSVSASARSFVTSLATMQPPSPGLSMVTRAEFTIITRRQNDSPLNGKVHTNRDRKKARQVKTKVKSMYIIFFDIKGFFFTKNSTWQTKQSIPHTTVTLYGDCVKCKDFAPNVGDKRASCCITTTHRLTLPFSPGIFLLRTT